MRYDVRDINRESLVRDSLRTFERQKLENVLGKERMLQYQSNRFSTTLIRDWALDRLGDNYSIGVANCLRGYEFNTILLSYLKTLTQDIIPEYEISETRVDAKAKIKGVNHSFEAKCMRRVSGKAVKQLRAAKKHFEVVNLYIAKDSEIPPDMLIDIQRLKANIIRSEYSVNDVIRRIETLKQNIQQIYIRSGDDGRMHLQE